MPGPGASRGQRLRAAAQRVAEAIERVNQPLPDAFPEAALLQIAENLRGLGDTEEEGDSQVLAHARFRIRDARRLVLENPDDPDAPAYYELERALNALLVEIGEELDRLPRQEQLALQPAPDPQLVVPRAALERQVAALRSRIDALGQARNEFNLVKVDLRASQIEIARNLSLNVDALVKNAMELKSELFGQLINLDWVGHLSNTIKALSGAVDEGIRALRAWAVELRAYIEQARRVRRLGTRIAAGARALLKAARRLLGRQIERGDSALKTLQIFKDIDEPWCPEMVVLSPGTFVMGAPNDEAESSRRDEPYDEADIRVIPPDEWNWRGFDQQYPQHEVQINYRVAVGRFPVTFDEYDRFALSTGRELPSDEGWGRGRRPVINVSWWCAEAYCTWLSKETGKPYRLLSEAEWEYACRAGTTTPFWTGDTISRLQANYGGEQTTPVNAFPANPWKLRDLHGNVFEWVEDCANKTYRGAPMDGSPWLRGDCDRRRLRGGCWASSDVARLSSTSRNWGVASFRNNGIGFRVGRTLTP